MPRRNGKVDRISVSKDYKKTEVVRLYLEGNTQSNIKNILEQQGIKISVPMISKYLKEARVEWREQRLGDMDIVLERELTALDKMEDNANKLFNKFDPTSAGSGVNIEDQFDSSKEASEWVKNTLKIMEMKHKLLGLYKPMKIDVESKSVNVNVNVESTEEIRSQILSRLSPRFK